MDTLFATFFPVVIILIVIGSIGEWILSSMWLPVYFRVAIPMLRRSYRLPDNPDIAGQIPALEQNLRRSWWRPAVVFRQISPTEIAFRNSFGSRNPVQGLVRLEPNHGRMTVTGNLYWSYLLFPLVFLAFVFGGGMPILFLLFMGGIFAFTFVVQRRNYEQIARIINETVGGEKWSGVEKWEGGETAVYDPAPIPSPQSPKTGLTTPEIILIGVAGVLVVAVTWLIIAQF